MSMFPADFTQQVDPLHPQSLNFNTTYTLRQRFGRQLSERYIVAISNYLYSTHSHRWPLWGVSHSGLYLLDNAPDQPRPPYLWASAADHSHPESLTIEDILGDPISSTHQRWSTHHA